MNGRTAQDELQRTYRLPKTVLICEYSPISVASKTINFIVGSFTVAAVILLLNGSMNSINALKAVLQQLRVVPQNDEVLSYG